jgi:hypothetical protein
MHYFVDEICEDFVEVSLNFFVETDCRTRQSTFRVTFLDRKAFDTGE